MIGTPGVSKRTNHAVHGDDTASFRDANARHGTCNAHHLRELLFLETRFRLYACAPTGRHMPEQLQYTVKFQKHDLDHILDWLFMI